MATYIKGDIIPLATYKRTLKKCGRWRKNLELIASPVYADVKMYRIIELDIYNNCLGEVASSSPHWLAIKINVVSSKAIAIED